MSLNLDQPRRSRIPTFFWADDNEWREAHQTLALLFRKHGRSLDHVRETALKIRVCLEELFPLFDELTARTCPDCRAVCCQLARVEYDFKDLLFMHALKLTPPPHQLRRHDREHCRYLTSEGCCLARIIRPFVCTWYFCAPMLNLYRELPPRDQRHYSGLMAEIQQGRRDMEDGFIRMVIG